MSTNAETPLPYQPKPMILSKSDDLHPPISMSGVYRNRQPHRTNYLHPI